MPTENSAQRLAEAVKTAQQKQALISQIENLLNDLAAVKPPTSATTQNKYPMIYKILLEQYGKSDTSITQENLLGLKKDLEDLEEVILDVPDAAAEGVVQFAHLWCKENVDPGVLVNIVPSKKLIAGAQCSCKGQYRDFSLDKVIHQKLYT